MLTILGLQVEEFYFARMNVLGLIKDHQKDKLDFAKNAVMSLRLSHHVPDYFAEIVALKYILGERENVSHPHNRLGRIYRLPRCRTACEFR
jgi:hypothetical protein